MKKTLSVTCYILFTLYGMLPLGTLLASLFGYVLSLSSYTAFAVITAAVSIFALVFIPHNADKIQSKTAKVMFALLPIFVIINWVFYILKITEAEPLTVIVSMMVCFGCSAILSALVGKPVILKVVSLVLLFLAILPLAGCTFLSMAFGDFGEYTVVDTVLSPDGEYYAEVIDCDQGALGGSTMVYVRTDKGFDALIFSVKKASRRVYVGEWGIYKNLYIYWKNEHCLVINSTEYEIN